MSRSSTKKLHWTVLLTIRASKVGTCCGLVNAFLPILVHECCKFVSRLMVLMHVQWCGVGILESLIGLGCYLVRTRVFSFYQTNNC